MSDPETIQIKFLLHEFVSIFPDVLGITTAAVFNVDVGDAVPLTAPLSYQSMSTCIRSSIYVCMLEHGIEPS